MIIKGNEYRSGNSGTKFKNNDTLFARITPSLENGKTGYVQFLDDENPIGFGSTEFIVLRSKTLSPEYVYCLARSNSFRDNAIKSMTGATGRQRVQNSCFDNYFFAQPSEDVLGKFTEVVRPMFELIDSLHRKNLNLRQQRDLLLPKLIYQLHMQMKICCILSRLPKELLLESRVIHKMNALSFQLRDNGV